MIRLGTSRSDGVSRFFQLSRADTNRYSGVPWETASRGAAWSSACGAAPGERHVDAIRREHTVSADIERKQQTRMSYGHVLAVTSSRAGPPSSGAQRQRPSMGESSDTSTTGGEHVAAVSF